MEVQEKEKDGLAEFDMGYVIVLEIEKHPLSCNQKNKVTMLHSIGNIFVGSIGVCALKLCCTKVAIAGLRSKQIMMCVLPL